MRLRLGWHFHTMCHVVRIYFTSGSISSEWWTDPSEPFANHLSRGSYPVKSGLRDAFLQAAGGRCSMCSLMFQMLFTHVAKMVSAEARGCITWRHQPRHMFFIRGRSSAPVNQTWVREGLYLAKNARINNFKAYIIVPWRFISSPMSSPMKSHDLCFYSTAQDPIFSPGEVSLGFSSSATKLCFFLRPATKILCLSSPSFLEPTGLIVFIRKSSYEQTFLWYLPKQHNHVDLFFQDFLEHERISTCYYHCCRRWQAREPFMVTFGPQSGRC